MKKPQSTRKHPKAKPTSTALVRRKASMARRVDVLPPAGPNPIQGNGAGQIGVLGEDVVLGALGLSELALTEKEEAVLAQPVNVADVLIKPTGQVYLPHVAYTRLLNSAFGRTGWAIVPAAKPTKSDRGIICPYVLRVHGQPVAFAWGEQDYFEGNREQSYGDALEATVASAIRRCAKRLGVGLELWEKAWGDRFVAQYGIRVAVRSRGETKYQWRRRQDPPFYNEIGSGAHTPEGEQVERSWRNETPAPAQRRAAPPPPAHTAAPQRESSQARPGGDWREQVISEKQVKRLWVILQNSGRNEATYKAWLLDRYGWDTSKKITRGEYDFIVSAVEADAPLPVRA